MTARWWRALDEGDAEEVHGDKGDGGAADEGPPAGASWGAGKEGVDGPGGGIGSYQGECK
jgi:hypothetical protein